MIDSPVSGISSALLLVCETRSRSVIAWRPSFIDRTVNVRLHGSLRDFLIEEMHLEGEWLVEIKEGDITVIHHFLWNAPDREWIYVGDVVSD